MHGLYSAGADVRERLIGASVLVVIAVILIPWLVSRAHHPREIVRNLPVPASATDSTPPYVLPLPTSGAAAPAATAVAGATRRSPEGGWSVQVASFSDRKAAATLAARLMRAGFKVFLSPHAVGKTVYYRVRVGPYAAAANARAAAPRVAAVSGTRVVVRGPGNDG